MWRRVRPRSWREPAYLRKRVEDLETTLAAITLAASTSASTGPPTEPAAQVDHGKAVKHAQNARAEINKALQSGEWRPVDEQDLESFMRGLVLVSTQSAGAETIGKWANEFLGDRTYVKTLQKLTERSPQLTDMADRVTDKITAPDEPGRSALRPLVLAAALLITAGIVLPFAAPVIEPVFTNELAIAGLVVGLAALNKAN